MTSHGLFPVKCGYSRNEFPANHNDPKTVDAEISQASFLVLLAQSSGIGQWRMGHPTILLSADGNSWQVKGRLHQRVRESLSSYLSIRAEGHSAAYSRDVMLIGMHRNAHTHRFLNDIPLDRDPVPESWITNVENRVNSDGNRIVNFQVVDGELGWPHRIYYQSNGRFDFHWSDRFDPVILNPSYQGIIKPIEERVSREMKAQGIEGLGSIHAYWRLKKEYLQKIGVVWRSPAELNPSTNYD